MVGNMGVEMARLRDNQWDRSNLVYMVDLI